MLIIDVKHECETICNHRGVWITVIHRGIAEAT